MIIQEVVCRLTEYSTISKCDNSIIRSSVRRSVEKIQSVDKILSIFLGNREKYFKLVQNL